MEEDKIKVLIADASSYMRVVMSDILNTDPGIEVVGTAQDGEDMLGKARLYKPDVIVLDADIPKSGRLSVLRRVLEQDEASFILIGKEEKIARALLLQSIERAAYQILDKPEGMLLPQMRLIADELVEKVKNASSVNVINSYAEVTETEPIEISAEEKHIRHRKKMLYTGKSPSHLVILGASTGGAPAIEYILRNLPSDLSAAILIAQHMPPGFSTTFTKRLNSICNLPVDEAKPNTKVEAGRIIVATGDANLQVKTVMGSKNNLCVDYSFDEYSAYDRPSVDVLMHSAAAIYEDRTVGIILSGMGKDGSIGLRSIHEKGGYTLAQDQNTSVIFGMAKSAIEDGVVDRVLPLSEIPRYLIHHIRQ